MSSAVRIEKLASADTFTRPSARFASGRAAFRSFLQQAGQGTVLLPAYIGWSPREGSGVFDPVRELGVPYAFYRVDRKLRIDLEDLERRLRDGANVLVLIHYFGVPDPGAAEAASLARRYGALVLEDEAHAMLTDLVGGISGRLGDACTFSLHKLLPVPSGGMLVLNSTAVAGRFGGALSAGRCTRAGDNSPVDLHSFDLHAIAARRRANVAALEALLPPLAPMVRPLWPGPAAAGIVWQTYPVVIEHSCRDELYHRLNDAGLGVVSLYHSLIAEVPAEEFADAHWLSRRILNLPIHQDTTPSALEVLVDTLGRTVASSPPRQD